jgi:hypothetical protein
LTGEDWNTHRLAVQKGKVARVDLSDIEADELIEAGSKALAQAAPERKAALARAIAKVKIARAAMAPSQAERERDKPKR